MSEKIGNVNKSLFLNSVRCLAHGWELRRSKYQVSPSLADCFRMEQGKEVHQRARELFPDGRMAGHPNLAENARRTKDLLGDKSIETIFEAAFEVEEYVAVADILVRGNEGYELIEIKSKTSVKPDLIEDIAYTCMVLRKAGLEINKATLMLVSPDYKRGMPDSALFQFIDVTEETFQSAEQFALSWSVVAKVTGQAQKPEVSLCLDCKNCPCCYEEFVRGKEYHIFEIPRLSLKKFVALKELEVEDLRQIPEDFDLTEIQEKVVLAARLGKPLIESGLQTALDSIKWPAGYLDFETFSTAIPEFDGISPWDQVAIQFSLHVCEKPGEISNHFEFLCEQNCESNEDLAQNLLDACRGLETIFVYSSFEERILKSLKDTYPEFTASIDDIISKITDLEKILKSSYYHPGFQGRTSIKKTLPVLAPDLSYEGMEIADGGDASAAFGFLRTGKMPSPNEMIENLLAYCKLDTLGMVRIHEQLVEEASSLQ